MIEKFLKETIILDTETTGYDLKTVDIVELATCKMVNGKWETRSELFGSRKPIPYSATAVNNITRKMLNSLDLFEEQTSKIADWLDVDNTKYFVAHNTQYDFGVMQNGFTRGSYGHVSFTDDEYKSRWICTFRLAKRLLIDEKEEDLAFNQAYLRYFFDLDSQMDSNITSVGAHRAEADAYVCSFLLLSLIEKAIELGLLDPTKDIGKQLIALTWDPMPLIKWPFGKKYKGVLFSDIPDSFYLWALTNMNELNEKHHYFNEDLANAIEDEMASRLELE